MSKKKLKYNLLKNDLLEASSSLTPEIPGILKLFSKINKCKYYNITGSGSACFGIFGDKKSLLNARKTFKESIEIIGQHQSKQLISFIIGA